MAQNGTPGKKGGHDALVLALAQGLSVAAAKRAGLSIRTVYRRLEDPAFRQQIPPR